MKRIIRLVYRKIIDVEAKTPWEKYVFDDAYAEFLIQSQLFETPDADKLNFLVSAAVVGYLKQLQGKVPDVMNNNGQLFLPFSNFKFEIINGDIKDKAKHKIAINFMSEPLIWHDTIGNNLLVSLDKNEEKEILTELFSIQPFLSIYSLKEIK